MKVLIKQKNLLLIPLFTYLISYLYLAYYHQQLFIFTTIIHESGKYNFLETTFYASHFLGHIPVHTILALYLVGWYLMLTRPDRVPYSLARLLTILVLFLFFSLLISLQFFGIEDTLAYLSQTRQQADGYVKGGSWNLHLPSTLMMFLLIPVYLYAVLRFLKLRIQSNQKANNYIVLAIAFVLLITLLVNYSNSSFWQIWTDARYQGHSVRELVTFSFTYLPLALFFLVKNNQVDQDSTTVLPRVVIIFASLFTLFFACQVFITLNTGLNNVTQLPDFARGESLSIFYLLASHFFEHFLDTIYFCLVALVFFIFKAKKAVLN